MNKENIRQIIIYGAGVIGNKNHEFLKRNSLDQYIYAFVIEIMKI